MTPSSPPAAESGRLHVLDLFSGLGAYSLGLERTGGFETAALCEINAYCRHNLKGHWPDATIYEDVEQLTGERLRADGIVPDWIVAGWPCQGNSPAGTGLGMDDPRSGLWAHIARLAGEIRPLGLLLENSSNLLAINDGRDFGRVLGNLAALGYDAEWHCLSAAAFDAPHIRDRVWIVATMADAEGERRQARRAEPAREQGRLVADCGGAHVALADSFAPVGTAIARQQRHTWEPESGVARVVAGLAHRVERVTALGNLNPPIIPESIGRAILTAWLPHPSPKE